MSIFRRIYSDLFNLNKDYALNYYGIQKINNEYNEEICKKIKKRTILVEKICNVYYNNGVTKIVK